MKTLRKWLGGRKLQLWVCGFGLVLVLILAAVFPSPTKDSIRGEAARNDQKKNGLSAHPGTGVLAVSSGNKSAASGFGMSAAGESTVSAAPSAPTDVSAPQVNSPYIPPSLPPAVSSMPTQTASSLPHVPVSEPLSVITPPIDKCLLIERPDGGGNQIDYNRCVIYCPDSCGRCGGYRPDIYLCVDPY